MVDRKSRKLLFCLEVYVDYINLTDRKVPENMTVSAQFHDFSPIMIKRSQREGKKQMESTMSTLAKSNNSQGQVIKFRKGKSCMFEMLPSELCRALRSSSMVVMVLGQLTGKQAALIGSVALDLSVLAGLTLGNSEKVGNRNKSGQQATSRFDAAGASNVWGRFSGVADLLSPFGSTCGQISMSIALSELSHGLKALVLSQPAVACGPIQLEQLAGKEKRKLRQSGNPVVETIELVEPPKSSRSFDSWESGDIPPGGDFKKINQPNQPDNIIEEKVPVQIVYSLESNVEAAAEEVEAEEVIHEEYDASPRTPRNLRSSHTDQISFMTASREIRKETVFPKKKHQAGATPQQSLRMSVQSNSSQQPDRSGLINDEIDPEFADYNSNSDDQTARSNDDRDFFEIEVSPRCSFQGTKSNPLEGSLKGKLLALNMEQNKASSQHATSRSKSSFEIRKDPVTPKSGSGTIRLEDWNKRVSASHSLDVAQRRSRSLQESARQHIPSATSLASQTGSLSTGRSIVSRRSSFHSSEPPFIAGSKNLSKSPSDKSTSVSRRNSRCSVTSIKSPRRTLSGASLTSSRIPSFHEDAPVAENTGFFRINDLEKEATKRFLELQQESPKHSTVQEKHTRRVSSDSTSERSSHSINELIQSMELLKRGQNQMKKDNPDLLSIDAILQQTSALEKSIGQHESVNLTALLGGLGFADDNGTDQSEQDSRYGGRVEERETPLPPPLYFYPGRPADTLKKETAEEVDDTVLIASRKLKTSSQGFKLNIPEREYDPLPFSKKGPKQTTHVMTDNEWRYSENEKILAETFAKSKSRLKDSSQQCQTNDQKLPWKQGSKDSREEETQELLKGLLQNAMNGNGDSILAKLFLELKSLNPALGQL